MNRNKFLIFIILISQIVVSQVPAYYSSIDFGQSGEALKSDLTTLISGHTEFPYSSSSTDTWDILQESDILSGDNVLLIYGYDDTDSNPITDRLRDKDDLCNFSGSCVGYWNREHVYPKSLATPDLETDSAGAGTDLHNLRAADSQMNSTRNNNEFETGSGNSGLTTNGFYPGDEYKGDVARIIMYMYTRYPSQCAANNVGYGNNTYNSNIPDIFLEWNEADPVSAFETARNNKIAEYQGNRNPFIDNAFLAYLIWGGPSVDDAWGTTQDPRIQFSSSSSENETDATFNTTIGVTMSSYDAPVTISVSVNGSSTAEAGDYTLNTATLTFNGNGTQNISLDINNDSDNDDETLILDVSITADAADPDTANLVISQHTITIVDDEHQIIITEIADPDNDRDGRYIEIYNSSNAAVDLSTYYLIRWTNGNDDPQTGKTTLSSECGSSLPAKTICVISEKAESTFSGIYGFSSDGDAADGGAAGSNGDDNIAIVTIASGVTYDNENSSTYTVIDMFGVAGEDGTGTTHEFEDGRAERVSTVITPQSTWSADDWNIDNDSGGGDGAQDAPGGYDPGYWIGATTIDTWNGLTDATWHTGGNWVSGSAPASGDNVFIRDSGTDPIISTTGIQVTNLTVESSGALTINAGKDLTLSGNFSNSGTVTLNSSSSSYSSLIVQGTSSGNITYNRYVNSLSNGEGWDLIGSPVDDLSISTFASNNTSPLATGGGSGSNQYAIGVYDNEAGSWSNWTTNSGSNDIANAGNFIKGKGYQMATDSGATLAFTGTIDVDATKTISVESFTDGSGTRWALLSNPYPSFITIGPNDTTDTFLEVNDDVIDATYVGVYGYDAETSIDVLYDIYNNTSSDKIAPGQGFFVAARSTNSATITFKEEMQTTSTGDDFISGDAMNDSYELLLRLYHENNVAGNTKLYFKDILTLGLDPGWDAGAFDQNSALMTRLVEEDEGHGLAINAMSTEIWMM